MIKMKAVWIQVLLLWAPTTTLGFVYSSSSTKNKATVRLYDAGFLNNPNQDVNWRNNRSSPDGLKTHLEPSSRSSTDRRDEAQQYYNQGAATGTYSYNPRDRVYRQDLDDAGFYQSRPPPRRYDQRDYSPFPYGGTFADDNRHIDRDEALFLRTNQWDSNTTPYRGLHGDKNQRLNRDNTPLYELDRRQSRQEQYRNSPSSSPTPYRGLFADNRRQDRDEVLFFQSDRRLPQQQQYRDSPSSSPTPYRGLFSDNRPQDRDALFFHPNQSQPRQQYGDSSSRTPYREPSVPNLTQYRGLFTNNRRQDRDEMLFYDMNMHQTQQQYSDPTSSSQAPFLGKFANNNRQRDRDESLFYDLDKQINSASRTPSQGLYAGRRQTAAPNTSDYVPQSQNSKQQDSIPGALAAFRGISADNRQGSANGQNRPMPYQDKSDQRQENESSEKSYLGIFANRGSGGRARFGSPSGVAEEVLHLINNERHRRHIKPLNHDRCLYKAAKQGTEIFRRLGRIDYDGESLKRRVKATGYDDIDPEKYNCRTWLAYYTEIHIPGEDSQQMVETLLSGKYREPLLSFDDAGVAYDGNVLVITLGRIEFQEKIPFTPQQQTSFANEVFRLTNLERMIRGDRPFVRDTLLDVAAWSHAKDMFERNFYSHKTPEGENERQRIERTGYLDLDTTTAIRWSTATAENIAKGQQSPEEVVRDWMESPDHRKNILSKDFEDLGVGVYGEHWVQNFGVRRVEYGSHDDPDLQLQHVALPTPGGPLF